MYVVPTMHGELIFESVLTYNTKSHQANSDQEIPVLNNTHNCNGKRNAGISIKSLQMETMLSPQTKTIKEGEKMASFETSIVFIAFAKRKIDVV